MRGVMMEIVKSDDMAYFQIILPEQRGNNN